MTRQRPMPDRAFAREVRDALLRLHDLPRLQVHPLRRFVATADQPRAETGRALQCCLLDAIASLGDGAPSTSPTAGRAQRLLALRYGEGLSAPEVGRHLAIGTSEYYREHARGLAALASLLAARWEVDESADGQAAPPQSSWLPAPLTSFVGRARERAALAALLAAARLVTVTGPPGVGKTRLALETARAQADAFPDGVWFVPLASLADPARVGAAIAHALGLREAGGASLDRLADALWDRRLLLLLDNCEQVVAAGPQLTALLEACPGLRILATSRTLLRVYGEHAFVVPPLGLGAREHAGEGEAEMLFVDRARAADPGFAPDAEELRAIGVVCRALDGLPLAIEIAAARVRTLPPRAMAAQVDRVLSIATDGPRDRAARQHTLRGAVAWSYELLEPGERRLFRRLAVFADGCDEAAAAMVCAGDGVATGDVGPLLARLVDHSLLLADHANGLVRYRMLETLRAHARERLAAAGEEDAFRARHRDWAVGLVDEAEPHLRGPEQAAWLVRLEAEHANIRAALAFCAERSDHGATLRLATALLRFWWQCGHAAEGRAWLAEALAGTPTGAPGRAAALDVAGWLAFVQDDLAAARSLIEEARALADALEDAATAAWAAAHLGFVLLRQGERAEASRQGEAALAAARRAPEPWAEPWALHLLGRVAELGGRLAEAHEHYAESIERRRALGDRQGLASGLFALARLTITRGDLAAGQSLAEASLAAAREASDRWDAAHAFGLLARIALERGDVARAEELTSESLAVARALGDRRGAAYALIALGRIALYRHDSALGRDRLRVGLAIVAELGDAFGAATGLAAAALMAVQVGAPNHALRLAGATSAICAQHAVRLPPAFQDALDGAVADARAVLPKLAADAAWADGSAWPLGEVVEHALVAFPE